MKNHRLSHAIGSLLRIFAACAALFVLPLSLTAQQTTPKVLHACYVPHSGVVYRVAETDLQPGCVASSHVLFSWNDRGEKGDKGDPGNLALAGHVCPSGQFVTGFDATGNLVCAAPGGGGEFDPLHGVWALTPTLAVACVGFSASADRLITDLSGSVFYVRLPLANGASTLPVTLPFPVPAGFDPNDVTTLTAAVSGDVRQFINNQFANNVTITGGTLRATVSFSSASLLQLSLSSDLSVTIDGTDYGCPGPSGIFTATPF